MRISIISLFYKPAGGGIPRYIDDISKKFAEMGHEVDIITASHNGKKIEKEGSVSVYRLPCLNIFRKDWNSKNMAQDFLKFLRSYTRKRKPDMFIAQNLHTSNKAVGQTMVLNMISLEKNIPLILTVHAFILEDEFMNLKLHMMQDLFWKKIISVGSNLAESLFKQGLSSEVLKVVNPPVNTEKFKPGLGNKWLRSRAGVSEKDFLILHASRLDSTKVAEEKGVFTLLKALSLVKDKNIKLLIAAAPTTPELQEAKEETIEKVKETAKLFNIEKRVFIESFDPDDMHLVYNGSDLFVMASQIESFGLVYAEALSCGIPVIGTSIGDIPLIVEDGKSGEIINSEDHVTLSNKISEMSKNKRKLKKMGDFGRKTIVERFDIDKICRKLIGVYESTLEKDEEKD